MNVTLVPAQPHQRPARPVQPAQPTQRPARRAPQQTAQPPAQPPAQPTGRRPARHLAPGLLLAGCATLLTLGAAGLLPGTSPLVLALALGAAVGTVAGASPAARRALTPTAPGTAWAATTLLRGGVVLLGLQLSLPQVLALGWRGLTVVGVTLAATFAGTLALGRLLRVPRTTTLLVATGFAVCGAAAVSAMTSVVERTRPDDGAAHLRDDVATALALVTGYGTLAVVALPWLADVWGLGDRRAGLWIGASVQEVAQVVAGAGTVSAAALATATVAKLARVALLAPLVAGAGAVLARGGAADRPHPPVPGFVVGFVAAVAVRSTGLVPDAVLDVTAVATTAALTAAMFAMGLGVDVVRLARTGRRALVLGAASSVLVTGVALAAILALSA